MLNVLTQNHVNLPKYFVAAIMMVSVSACGSNKITEKSTASTAQSPIYQSQMAVVKTVDPQLKEDKTMILTGQIRYQNFEGGFYSFIANDGKKYMPSGLKEEHRKNGLIVEMKVQPITDRMTTQQFGTLVKVLEIKIIDDSKVSDINQSM
jgi:hypothetical protein